jgi:hypothetical protein
MIRVKGEWRRVEWRCRKWGRAEAVMAVRMVLVISTHIRLDLIRS